MGFYLPNQQNVFTNHIYFIYMYKEDLALNNLQWLIYYKTKPISFAYREALQEVAVVSTYDAIAFGDDIAGLCFCISSNDHCFSSVPVLTS